MAFSLRIINTERTRSVPLTQEQMDLLVPLFNRPKRVPAGKFDSEALEVLTAAGKAPDFYSLEAEPYTELKAKK